MANFRVLVRASAAAELEGLPASQRARVLDCISTLVARGHPEARERIAGREEYRVRLRGCVLVYAVDQERECLVVAAVREALPARGFEKNQAIFP